MFPSLRVSTRTGVPVSRRLLSSSVCRMDAQSKLDKKAKIDAMKSSDSWGGSESAGPVDLNEGNRTMAKSLSKAMEPPVFIAKSLHRNFRMGETYTPFDFSMNRFEMEQKARASIKKIDPFARAGIDPSTLYLMPEILSKFLTSTGQILPRDATGCSSKNQKKLAMAIEYARSLGLLSSKHRHARYMPTRNM